MFFEPDGAFANSVVKTPAVKDFLDKNVFTGRSVYVITGIEIARGASIAKSRKDGFVLDASAAISTGAQTSVGPSVSVEKTLAQTETFGNSSDFVYAYRSKKIWVSRQGKTGSKEVKAENCTLMVDLIVMKKVRRILVKLKSAVVEVIDFGLGFRPQGLVF